MRECSVLPNTKQQHEHQPKKCNLFKQRTDMRQNVMQMIGVNWENMPRQ